MRQKLLKYTVLGLSLFTLAIFLYGAKSVFFKSNSILMPKALHYGYSQETQTLDLYFLDYQGLGNRLKYMISYIRYYKPKNLRLHWPSRGWVNKRFSDLFVLNLPIQISEYSALIQISKYDVVRANPLYRYVKTWGLIVAKTDYDNGEIPQSIDFKYNDISPNLIDIYRFYFTHILPSASVKKRLLEVKLPENTVSVQVRNAPDWEKYYGSNEQLSSFFDVMDNLPVDTIFYLSAMSKEVANEFYKRYPNRIIELPNKNYLSMVDATADMYILGSTKSLLCSFHSTFCEVAWWLGGAKAKVTIIGSNKNWKKKPASIEIIDTIPSY